MAAKPLQLVNNMPTEVEANVASAGAGDAGKLVALDAAGRIDSTMMPVGIGSDTATIQASENLAAGDYVNIHEVSTSPRVRKADASTASAGKVAHGFVLNSVTSGNNATVYFEGSNTQLTSLTIGATYVLSHSTPGGVLALASATTTAGHIVQVLGTATSATSIATELAAPIMRG